MRPLDILRAGFNLRVLSSTRGSLPSVRHGVAPSPPEGPQETLGNLTKIQNRKTATKIGENTFIGRGRVQGKTNSIKLAVDQFRTELQAGRACGHQLKATLVLLGVVGRAVKGSTLQLVR